MTSLPTNHREDFATVRDGAVGGVVHKVWQERMGPLAELLEATIADPGKVLRKGGGQGLTSMKEFQGTRLFFKVYFPGKFRRRLRDLFLVPRWQREWEANCRAQQVGIHSARIVTAFGRREGLSTTHLVVTEAIAGRDIASVLSKMESPTERAEILRQFGRYVGSLHARGFWHAHLHCKHVFLTDCGNMTLIDLERSFIDPKLSPALVKRNLHQVRKSVGKYARGAGELGIFDEAYRLGLNNKG